MTREEIIKGLKIIEITAGTEQEKLYASEAIQELSQEPCENKSIMNYTELDKAILHIKTRADAWAVKEVTEALQSISERMDKALSQEPCTDAVSREAVLEMAYDMSEIDGEHFTEPHMVVDVEDIQKSPSVTPNRQWIPVSKRLPQSSGNYLITYCLQDKIETQEAVYVEDEDKWYDITDIEITLAVVAWMPLPEPYKVEPQESEG